MKATIATSKKPQVVAVEGYPIVSEIVSARRTTDGFDVFRAGDATSARCTFDLAIPDVNLPDGSGFDLADRLRQRRDCGVLHMTSSGSPEYRLRGLEKSDDYIVRPVDMREFLARARAVLCRYRPPPPAEPRLPVIEPGRSTLDLVRRALAGPDGGVKPTRAAFDLFAALVQSGNKSLSHDDLLEAAASADTVSKARTMDVLVSRIRSKFAAGGQPSPRIVTRQGEGYRFASPSA
jgi:DNA-binding response OmpR family regulator